MEQHGNYRETASPPAASNAGATTWSRGDIEQFLASEDLRYQKIALPHGLSTPGADRREVCDLAFAGDISGMTILDIGSYLGYFCFEALKRGAVSATGMEVDPIKLRQASALAEIQGLPAAFRMQDIEKAALDQSYDIVLCLNILHHLFDPVGVLHKLATATRRRLVLEVASLNPRDARKLGIRGVTRLLIGNLPVIFVARGIPSMKGHGEVQKYFFTPAAILRILDSHRFLFSRIDIRPSSHKQRFIVVASKRRIGTLLIVSGPTSSGKSTFLTRIADATLPPALAAQLPAASRHWPMVGASRLLQAKANGRPVLPDGDLDGMVLHYDFLRPLASGSQDFRRDQALDLISCADRVVVMVLKPERERLLRQFADSELSGRKDRGGLATLRRMAGLTKGKKRHEELYACYRRSGWLESWYQRWEDFIREAAPAASMVTVDDSYYLPPARS